MKTFKEFLSEGGVVSTQREIKANFDEPETIDELNRTLLQVTSVCFVNPYSALQSVSKVLSTYGIVLPQVTYLPEPKGEEVFTVVPFGQHTGWDRKFHDHILGIQATGRIATQAGAADESLEDGETVFVYFCWEMNEHGIYDTFAMVVDHEGLETILAVEETDHEEGEELEETVKHIQKYHHPDKGQGSIFYENGVYKTQVNIGYGELRSDRYHIHDSLDSAQKQMEKLGYKPK